MGKALATKSDNLQSVPGTQIVKRQLLKIVQPIHKYIHTTYTHIYTHTYAYEYCGMHSLIQILTHSHYNYFLKKPNFKYRYYGDESVVIYNPMML